MTHMKTPGLAGGLVGVCLRTSEFVLVHNIRKVRKPGTLRHASLRFRFVQFTVRGGLLSP
jgi:hypothetical protein